jgi:hypothetical protein
MRDLQMRKKIFLLSLLLLIITQSGNAQIRPSEICIQEECKVHHHTDYTCSAIQTNYSNAVTQYQEVLKTIFNSGSLDKYPELKLVIDGVIKNIDTNKTYPSLKTSYDLIMDEAANSKFDTEQFHYLCKQLGRSCSRVKEWKADNYNYKDNSCRASCGFDLGQNLNPCNPNS